MMINVVHKIAQNTGSDERAVIAGLVAVSASLGGAVLFQTLSM
jgi:hypothetical protein